MAYALDPALPYVVEHPAVDYLRTETRTFGARIYQPVGPGPFPILVYIHGGAWTNGSREHDAIINNTLAGAGMVVVSLDFGQAPTYQHPEPMFHINYATRWLKAHAHDFHADGRTLGGAGGSSGGHQIMLSAMRARTGMYGGLPLTEAPEADAALDYVLCYWSILDPYGRYLWAQDVERPDLVTRTEGYFGSPEAMQEASPQLILDRGEPVELPPAILIQGTADGNVTPAMQERFAASYRAAGGECELNVFPDMPHGSGGWTEANRQHMLGLLIDFVNRQLMKMA